MPTDDDRRHPGARLDRRPPVAQAPGWAMARPTLTRDQREAILAAARGGESCTHIAKRLGVHHTTVSRIVASGRVDIVAVAAERAHQANRDFAAARRLEMLNRLAERIAEKLEEPHLAPIHLQQLATATAIVIDKRRLEEGQATERHEVSSVGARERIAGRLDELAARRAAKQLTG